MNRRGVWRAAAATTALGLVLLAVSPAWGATVVARGTASALTIGLAGTPAYSGQYSATHDGTRQTTEGSNKPALSALGSQQVITAGTLNQDAGTSVTGGTGTSSACAGLAGSGATLVAVGESSCLQPGGAAVALDAGALDLTGLDAGTILGGAGLGTIIDQLPTDLLGQITGGAQTVTDTVTSTLTPVLQQLLGALGNPAVTLGAGVVQGRCTATLGSASGSAQLVDAGLKVDLGSQAAALGIDPVTVSLPSDPAPNTKVLTNLSAVTKEITDALSASLTAQSGPLSTLGLTTAQIADLINPVVAQVSSQLAPLQQNLLDITLNKQERDGDSTIHVTALDAQVLPAAAQVLGTSFASIQIGDVTCTGARAVTPVVDVPVPTVPTKVDSGLAGQPFGLPSAVLTAIGALLLAGAAGVGVRRLRSR